ncbi:MAG: 30S ribosomal protein S1 [Elusimicrobia bacterium]|nr:30S ribosomal protein S1 [Elusimicrobiota bacterium]
MSLDENKPIEEGEEDFAKLFEATTETHVSAGSRDITVGRVVSKHEDYYLMDIGLKLEGRLKAGEVPQGLSLEPGALLPVVRSGAPQEGFGPLLSLKYAVRSLQVQRLRRYQQENQRLDAQIFRRRGDGFFVGLDVEPDASAGLPAGIPAKLWKLVPYPAEMPLAELDTDDPRPIHRWLGRRVQVKILDMRGDGLVLVSRKKVAIEMKEVLRRETLTSAKEGDTLTAKIREITPEGLRMDVSGVEAHLPQTEASWYPKADLRRRFRVGETLEVKVMKKDEQAERFLVSRRAVEPHPADALEAKFRRGSVIEGTVSKVLPNGGCFVRIDGIKREAFVPAGETVKDTPPKEGTKIKATIIRVDRENIRVILSPKKFEDKMMPDMVRQYSKESQPFSLGQILNPSEEAEEGDTPEGGSVESP